MLNVRRDVARETQVKILSNILLRSRNFSKSLQRCPTNVGRGGQYLLDILLVYILSDILLKHLTC